MAHEIPYVATATVADLHDLEAKVIRAMGVRGSRYIHVLVPCPLGWGSEPALTIELARLATECGLFPLFEAEGGELVRSTPIRRLRPVADYLKPQKRFAHLFHKGHDNGEQIRFLEAVADRNLRTYDLISPSTERHEVFGSVPNIGEEAL
jgi:pyruvate ferredoxin oxidoreductase beta subunit